MHIEKFELQLIEYYLLPESGYTGIYDRKEEHYLIKRGTVADLIHDSKMLWNSEYDKVIPSMAELNNILRKGCLPRIAEWQPTEVDELEYEEIVRVLMDISMTKPYRI